MTQEELVKKAEDYQIEQMINLEDFDDYEKSYARFEDGVFNAYIAGAKENGVIWHDLRKNPDDVPKKVGNYIVCYLDTMLERHTFELSYVDYLGKEHWIDEYNHNIETYDEGVIAWCEIPKFEEIKE